MINLLLLTADCRFGIVLKP